jgi:hypothetical protein
LRPVAFFLCFFLAAVEALSLPAGVAGGLFVGGVVGVFVAVLFHVVFLLGITAEGATTVPGVLFDFVASPLSFFAFFLLGVAVSPEVTDFRFNAFFVSPNFASSDWMRR